MKAVRPGRQSLANLEHMASMMLHVKNGSQQKRKTPVWREQQTEQKRKEKQTTNTVKVNSYRTLLTAIETFLFPLGFGFSFFVSFFFIFFCVCVLTSTYPKLWPVFWWPCVPFWLTISHVSFWRPCAPCIS